MNRYLVEVPHDEEMLACARVVQTFLQTGSHYLTHADWGCQDGNHSAWMIVEAADREEARWAVPAPFRAQARVVRLNRFSVQEADEMVESHRVRDSLASSAAAP